jgi:hypothetical protein
MTDVENMIVIGQVVTFDDRHYDIVEVFKIEEQIFYICNQWYKKYKKIPLMIHQDCVKHFT